MSTYIPPPHVALEPMRADTILTGKGMNPAVRVSRQWPGRLWVKSQVESYQRL